MAQISNTCEPTDITKLFDNGEDKEPTQCLIKGNVPSWINGQLIRNGPGLFDIGTDSYDHWFDGLSLIHKFHISDGNVTYSSKFLQSDCYKTNKEQGRIIATSLGSVTHNDPCESTFKRFFSKFFSKKVQSDNCNVSIAKLGDDYYALTDAAFAYRINDDTLDTKNKINMTEMIGVNTSTSHPHYDVNGDYYNMGSIYGKHSYYCIVKVAAESMHKEDPLKDLQIQSRIPIDDPFNPSFYHSFAITSNYIIFHEQPARINIFKALKAQLFCKPMVNAMVVDYSRESVYHVIRKATGEKMKLRFASSGMFSFHHINAYEQEDKDGNLFIVMDLCASNNASMSSATLTNRKLICENGERLKEAIIRGQGHCRPTRLALPLNINENTVKVGRNLINLPGVEATAELRKDGSVFLTPEFLISDKVRSEIASMDLPQINYEQCNGRKYKFLYCVGVSEIVPDQLVKIDVDTKQCKLWKEKDYYPSEPIFVSNPGSRDEDDGVVLSTVISRHSEDPTFLLVLDAKTFTELGRAEVNAKVPYPFHGLFGRFDSENDCVSLS